MAHLDPLARRWGELIDQKFLQGLIECEVAEIDCLDRVLTFAHAERNEVAVRTLLRLIHERLEGAR